LHQCKASAYISNIFQRYINKYGNESIQRENANREMGREMGSSREDNEKPQDVNVQEMALIRRFQVQVQQYQRQN
jgi:hypothetical protein